MKSIKKSKEQRYILIKNKGVIKKINIEDISHITCSGYLSTIHLLNDNKNYSHCKLLKEYEVELMGKGFYRINRNTLININYIFEINFINKPILELINKLKFRVSKRRKKELLLII